MMAGAEMNVGALRAHGVKPNHFVAVFREVVRAGDDTYLVCNGLWVVDVVVEVSAR
jgi:hypothetical protein